MKPEATTRLAGFVLMILSFGLCFTSETPYQELYAPIDYAVVGQQKCGTSSLWHYMMDHPDITWHGKKKESLYFHTDWPASANCDNRVDNYLLSGGEMRRARNRTLDLRVGDWSATHLSCICCPVVLKTINPKLKIIVLLRDPIQRALSRFLEQRERVKGPLHNETANHTFASFVELDLRTVQECLNTASPYDKERQKPESQQPQQQQLQPNGELQQQQPRRQQQQQGKQQQDEGVHDNSNGLPPPPQLTLTDVLPQHPHHHQESVWQRRRLKQQQQPQHSQLRGLSTATATSVDPFATSGGLSAGNAAAASSTDAIAAAASAAAAAAAAGASTGASGSASSGGGGGGGGSTAISSAAPADVHSSSSSSESSSFAGWGAGMSLARWMEAQCYSRSSVLGWSVYDIFLENYLAHFPAEQLLVLYTEALAVHPLATVRKLESFLGVRPALYNHSLFSTVYNSRGCYTWDCARTRQKQDQPQPRPEQQQPNSRLLSQSQTATQQPGPTTPPGARAAVDQQVPPPHLHHQNQHISLDSHLMSRLRAFYRPHMQRIFYLADAGFIAQPPGFWRTNYG
ncbi:hypothetical protein Agub_g10052 [Astrephomene gubernaculifera]|uniref:Sulfotransferase n=1 Tax=Astrephomene gubernaculifera TaxID=47775 RepID=A0AAD3HPQ5_9CHLO|nr:hypothetical protein Agub_g10052 [Astrephomene gubernaculifera]